MRSHPKKCQVVQADSAPRGDSSYIVKLRESLCHSQVTFMTNSSCWGQQWKEAVLLMQRTQVSWLVCQSRCKSCRQSRLLLRFNKCVDKNKKSEINKYLSRGNQCLVQRQVVCSFFLRHSSMIPCTRSTHVAAICSDCWRRYSTSISLLMLVGYHQSHKKVPCILCH